MTGGVDITEVILLNISYSIYRRFFFARSFIFFSNSHPRYFWTPSHIDWRFVEKKGNGYLFFNPARPFFRPRLRLGTQFPPQNIH